MTLYSRYLLLSYFKILGLTLGTFIAFLLVYQLEDVAQFAAFGVPLSKLCLFIFLQIPFLLPLALPIACLLASLLLMQRLSTANELTALRASGYSLMHILLPLLTAGSFLSLAAFYINSELATSAHRKTREMIVEVTSINPLVMLQHSAIGQLKGAFVQMDPICQGHDVANLVVALPGKRLVLGLCDRLSIVEGELQGEQTSWITTLPQEQGFDHLILENLNCTHSPAVELMTLLRTKGWRLAHDHLCWRLLSARERELSKLSTQKAFQQLRQMQNSKSPTFFFRTYASHIYTNGSSFWYSYTKK